MKVQESILDKFLHDQRQKELAAQKLEKDKRRRK